MWWNGRRGRFKISLLQGSAVSSPVIRTNLRFKSCHLSSPGACLPHPLLPDVATYTGSVQLAPTGPHTWTVTWRIAGEVTNGVGIVTDNILSVGYVTGGQTGVASFIPQPDGTLLGRWTTGRNNATSGNERWQPR